MGIFKKKREYHEPKHETLKDIDAIKLFLQDAKEDIAHLEEDIKDFEELVKEALVATQGVIQINLDSQAKVLDSLLERYNFFTNDTAINSIRLQEIAKNTLKRAHEEGMKDLVAQKKIDERWQMDL